MRMQPPTKEQQQQWMAQWRSAAVALERVHRDELRRVDHRLLVDTFEDAFEAFVDAFAAPSTSGLVEQQRYFSRFAR
jgi:hypothetical protein